MTICHSIRFARNWPSCLAIAAILCLLGISAANAQQSSRHRRRPPRARRRHQIGRRESMLKVLGSDGEDIMFSGDEVADREARQRFVGAYDAKHNATVEGDKAVSFSAPTTSRFRFR